MTSQSHSEQRSWRSEALALFVGMRPGQWVKNLFVLAPLVFAKYLDHPERVAQALAAFVSFCVASGVVYLINDIRDLEADRLHPIKKNRPLASGRLRVSVAAWAAALAALASVALGALLGRLFVLVLAGYYLLNVAYSLELKTLPYLDVAAIAAGFLLRVLAGSAAVSVSPSQWLLACTVLLASYLGLGKRLHELVSLGDQASGHRAVLAYYRKRHLDLVMAVLGLATLLSYVVYTLSEHTRTFFGTDYLVASSVFVAYALHRFRKLALEADRPGSPTEVMLRDRPFLAALALWGVCVLGVIYFLPR